MKNNKVDSYKFLGCLPPRNGEPFPHFSSIVAVPETKNKL